ncbi:competence type IV pilus ATPase ComGA [Macrococcus brunensis]|uniref:competence type IV pilus ATPase ComGA n=1 Tax=Macrococcus brunensis TaxID=198483 RepID=UPI001EF0F202|nr:competence type IV pilus ATPase ComGA [Macrococcus brunensis]ULG71093.1 Flp pilus assembly complex ATPase component TadA [Macrococcus brunensis]ULG73429.1 Flp pilus assembly complex ATPase component TadA [Macrococcus brunensis]
MKEKVDEIISAGIKRQASDIHFVPSAEHIYLKMRIEGVIERISTMDHTTYEKILAYLKFVSQLNVSERKTSQSGMLQVTHEDTLYHIRISTLPQSVGSEAAVLRLLKAEFSAEPLIDNELLFQMMKLSHGLILMTGPTGSGKSTLMYHLLAYARDKLQKQIITIEDPVEQTLHETIQVNVNEKAGITYQSSFKAILRCDPDIIMIGEIRDDETAKQVINAALSGHLVLSTLHANNCTGAIERLMEMGNNPSEIKQAVQLITNQRLIRMRTGRELVLEMFNQQQVEEYFSNQAVDHYISIAEQLETLYHSQQITLSELEKHRVVN